MTRYKDWHFLALIFGALWLSIILPTCAPAYAAAAEACTSTDETLAAIQKRDPAARIVEFGERERATLSDAYNKTPPVGDVPVDRIVGVTTSAQPRMVGVILSNEGCVVDYGRFPVEYLNQLLGSTPL